MTAKAFGDMQLLLGTLSQWRVSVKWVAIAWALTSVMRMTRGPMVLGLGMISSAQQRLGAPALCMASVYLTLAFTVVIFAGSSFVRKPDIVISSTVEAARTSQIAAAK